MERERGRGLLVVVGADARKARIHGLAQRDAALQRERASSGKRPEEPSGVVGDATKASRETGERIVEALVPRIVQVAREMARKEP